MADALTILVADDEPLVRRALSILLTSAGFRVCEAQNSVEANAKVESEVLSLVISDINMPGNEDLGFVRAVAAKHPGLPIILLTAYPTVETAVASVNLAVAAYLVKPPDAEKVLNAVRTAIGHREARDGVLRSLARLQDWTRDLEQLDKLMSNVRASSEVNSTGAYLELTLRHTMSSLLELREVVSALGASPAGSESVRAVELAKALQETVEVLEKTKRVFKSKDLGELRQKLEAVLAAVADRR